MGRPVPVFVGTVSVDGKLRLEGRTLLDRHLLSLRNQVVEVVVRKRGRPKSQTQLGYLWGVLYPVIADHFGYNRWELDALHDGILRELRGLKPGPNPLKLRVSLSEMSHDQVREYISDLRHWALTEHGVVTPDAVQVAA